MRYLTGAKPLQVQFDLLAEHKAGALLHNKAVDSLGELDVIDGRDAQTDTCEVSHDQLARI